MQSLSFVGLHPCGQHPSPEVHDVMSSCVQNPSTQLSVVHESLSSHWDGFSHSIQFCSDSTLYCDSVSALQPSGIVDVSVSVRVPASPTRLLMTYVPSRILTISFVTSRGGPAPARIILRACGSFRVPLLLYSAVMDIESPSQ